MGDGDDDNGVPPQGNHPDLVVESLSVSERTLNAGESFTLNATVRNLGAGQSAATTLRYYRSTDATIYDRRYGGRHRRCERTCRFQYR